MPTNQLHETWRTTEVTDFHLMECGNCGIVFYVPEVFWSNRLRDAQTWYCPNGHGRVYRETEGDRLRKRLADEQERSAFLRNEAQRAREARQHAEKRVSAMKGVVTRTKRRIAAGKCIRCSCEFPDLAEHMAEAHPDFDPEA